MTPPRVCGTVAVMTVDLYWIPLGAGLALLAFLGTSKRADLAGHLCGFAAGVVLGASISLLPRVRSIPAQAALAVAALACVAVAWLKAFQ